MQLYFHSRVSELQKQFTSIPAALVWWSSSLAYQRATSTLHMSWPWPLGWECVATSLPGQNFLPQVIFMFNLICSHYGDTLHLFWSLLNFCVIGSYMNFVEVFSNWLSFHTMPDAVIFSNMHIPRPFLHHFPLYRNGMYVGTQARVMRKEKIFSHFRECRRVGGTDNSTAR